MAGDRTDKLVLPDYLGARARQVLKYIGVYYKDELALLSVRRLMRIKGCGLKTANQIIRFRDEVIEPRIDAMLVVAKKLDAGEIAEVTNAIAAAVELAKSTKHAAKDSGYRNATYTAVSKKKLFVLKRALRNIDPKILGAE